LDASNPLLIGGVIGGAVALALVGAAWKAAARWAAARDVRSRRRALPRRRPPRSVAAASAMAPKMEMPVVGERGGGAAAPLGGALGGAGALPS
jgi:hypothetical protein